jgi:hypothetical protein
MVNRLHVVPLTSEDARAFVAAEPTMSSHRRPSALLAA